MKKIVLTLFIITAYHFTYAQSQITTTGNNLINPVNPYAADIVIGSDSNSGIRHDASIMWWSSGSASRISNTNDVFNFSVWNTTNPNVSLSALLGGPSYFQGKVGIGTINPGFPLTISTAAPGNYKSFALSNNNTGGGTGTSIYMGFQADSGDPYGIRLLQSGNPSATRSGTFAIQRHGSTLGDADWLNSLFIDYSGYVGIGTSSPDSKLTVGGTVHATEVVVDQTVTQPDYVFDKDYDLSTLKEVKTYIDKNHHLPEIPSAAQVAKEGINLGEMNTMLLKKIEELTLYLIEKYSEAENQKKINQTLQDQINQLKTQINSQQHQ